jgi:DNA-directed RNA polymerase specialized sigma subunit
MATTTGPGGDDTIPERDSERHEHNCDLVRRWQAATAAGDSDGAAALLNQAVEDNMGLVMWWARRYAGVCVQDQIGDLEREGREGLIRALTTWDPDGGAALSTWAAMPIRTRLQRRVVALYGRRLAPVARLVVQSRRELESTLGRTATDEELSEHTGLTAARLNEIERDIAAIRERARPASLDDDRWGDRYERTQPGHSEQANVENGRDLAAILDNAALPVRWQRLARHLVTATRTATLDDAVASYAAKVGTSTDDVAVELAQLVTHLGRDQ